MAKIADKLIFLAIFVLLSAGLYFFIDYYFYQKIQFFRDTSQLSKKTDTPGIGLPAQIIIPAISIQADIKHLGLDASGSISAPEKPYDTAWFEMGPKPGESGTSIISGHYGKWKNGAGSIFDNLDQLRPGDSIYVKDDLENTLEFEVQGTNIYNPEDTIQQVLVHSGESYLALITCAGDWIAEKKTYAKRLAVFAKIKN